MKIANIKGYEGLYAVSDDGRVFSLGRGIEMKQRTDINGYKRVELSKSGESRGYFVHDLVLNAFFPKRKGSKLVCDHINCDKTDNRLENLRWLTTRENTSRAKTNRYARGVCFYKKTGHYGANIQIDNIQYHLGVFDTMEEASECYQNALRDYEERGVLPFKRDRTVKYCHKCERTLPLSAFYNIKSHGHSWMCKECARAFAKELRLKKKLNTQVNLWN